jgi:hypothetical protein
MSLERKQRHRETIDLWRWAKNEPFSPHHAFLLDDIDDHYGHIVVSIDIWE